MKNIRLKAIISTLEALQDMLDYVKTCGTDEYYGYVVADFFAVVHAYNNIGLISWGDKDAIFDYIYSLDYSGCVRYLYALGVSCNA